MELSFETCQVNEQRRKKHSKVSGTCIHRIPSPAKIGTLYAAIAELHVNYI